LIIWVGEDGCDFTGPSKVWKGEDKHLTIFSRFDIETLIAIDEVQFEVTTYPALQIWVWPNGFQQNYHTQWKPKIKVIEN
jgi:hypothetical protein